MNRRGISLIETIASVLMVALVATAVMQLVAQEFDTAERARRAVELEPMVKSRLDVLGLLTEDDLLSLPDTLQGGVFDWPLDEYAWTMTAIPSSEDIGVFDIELEITWPPDHSYLVQTSVYRRPAITTVQ